MGVIDVSPPEEVFEHLVETQLAHSGISVGKMFASRVLKVTGSVFAMVVKGRLVVKLPKERVEEPLRSGLVEPFDPGHRKPSKEWVAVAAIAS